MEKKDRYRFTTAGSTLDDSVDRKKLEDLAKEGWVPVSYAWGGFALKLEKTEPQHLVYAMDCYNGSEEGYEEYVELFEASGWTKVFSHQEGRWGMLTLFKAEPGTPPLYSDPLTHSEHFYSQRNSLLTHYILPGLGISGAFFGLSRLFDGEIVAKLLGMGTTLTILWVIAMGYGAAVFHIKGKKAAESKNTDIFEVTPKVALKKSTIWTPLSSALLFFALYWGSGGDFRPGSDALYLNLFFVAGVMEIFKFVSLLPRAWRMKSLEVEIVVPTFSKSRKQTYFLYQFGRLTLFFAGVVLWMTGFFGLF